MSPPPTHTLLPYHSINSHVQQSPGPHNVEDAVNVLKNGLHHFILVLGSWPVRVGGGTYHTHTHTRAHTSTHSLILRVTARMNDTVHIKVEIVKLNVIGVRLSCVHWDRHILNHLSLQPTHIGSIGKVHA